MKIDREQEREKETGTETRREREGVTGTETRRETDTDHRAIQGQRSGKRETEIRERDWLRDQEGERQKLGKRERGNRDQERLGQRDRHSGADRESIAERRGIASLRFPVQSAGAATQGRVLSRWLSLGVPLVLGTAQGGCLSQGCWGC